MMLYQTYQRTLEPQKQTFNMCHHLLVLEVLNKQDCCSVAKWHLVNHVGVAHHDVPGCSRRVPDQGVLFALILWYVAKTIY